MMHILSIVLYFTSLLLVIRVESNVSIGLLRKSGRNPKPSGYGNRPRGVPYARGPLYATDETFACVDNSKTIPFAQVNDDYCDCPDGSDEPGTSACPNGKFHCLNRGFQAEDIPSSRVNDQICDCCDGSDEWDSAVDCPDVCNELGVKYREEIRQKSELAKKGYVKRIELIVTGQQLKAEKLKTLEALKEEKEEITKRRMEAEAKMNEKRKLETEARKNHDKAWEEEKKKLNREYAQMLFTAFDANKDEKVSFEELKAAKEFDVNEDGTVTDDEIKYVLPDGKEECDFETFVESVYDNIHHYFDKSKEEGKEEQGNQDTAIPPVDVETVSESPAAEGEKDETPNAAEDGTGGETKSGEEVISAKIPQIPNVELNKPAFSEETKSIIKESEDAKKEFDEVDKRYEELESSIKDAEQYASDDFGTDMAWAPLKGKCVETSENEYTYKLCLFDKATQKSKDSPIEIDLGKWNGWIGEEPNKYTMQKYDKGTPCWNGPDRWTRVTIVCGEETELVETSEPSRCEYLFTLRSPAACPDPASLVEHTHEEF